MKGKSICTAMLLCPLCQPHLLSILSFPWHASPSSFHCISAQPALDGRHRDRLPAGHSCRIAPGRISPARPDRWPPTPTRRCPAVGRGGYRCHRYRPVDATLLAADSDCRCIALATPLPVRLPADQVVTLRLAVAGVQPGMNTMTLRTTAGMAQTQVQVVTAGLGAGRDVLSELVTVAKDRGLSPWFIVHDLRGELRNCGCSGGSLGGVEHLAALPIEVARLEPKVAARFLLSGDSEGTVPGLGAALAEHSWTPDEQPVLVSADAATAVSTPGAGW